MTKRECEQTMKAIRRDASVELTGVRIERVRGGANYMIDCRDRQTGSAFVVYSRKDWDERRARAMIG